MPPAPIEQSTGPPWWVELTESFLQLRKMSHDEEISLGSERTQLSTGFYGKDSNLPRQLKAGVKEMALYVK